MAELLLILRLLADLLWPYKEVTAAVASIAIISLLFGFFFRGAGKKLVLYPAALSLCVVYAFVVLNFLISSSQDALPIFVKITANVALFFWGVRCEGLSKRGSKFLVGALLFEFAALIAMAFIGAGYIYWGSTLTFVGPFFFKTDLAIACLIIIILTLSSDLPDSVKIGVSALSMYMLWVSNSRMSVLSAFFVVYLWRIYFVRMNRKIEIARIGMILLATIVMAISALVVIAGDAMLSFDLTEDLFSEKNTQGRNLIWEALFDEMYKSSLAQNLIGHGLGADQFVVSRDTPLEVDSHNTFLSILFNSGGVAFLGFLLFLVFVFMNIKRYAGYNNESVRKRLFLALSFYFVFVINSMTMTLFVYQQLTWFFMFFSGVVTASERRLWWSSREYR